MFEQLCSWENLHLAYRLAAKGKRGHANVARFEHGLEDNLLTVQRELIEGVYRPGPYTSFWIHEPKRRLISAAPFRDRVVHHALCNLIEPIFERTFVADSYANRKGKGTHEILRRQIQCKVQDRDVVRLVDAILASGVGVQDEIYEPVFFPGDDLFAVLRPRGLPIGNLTSQFWANVYLNPFDHFVKRQLGCPGYVRYVDDVILFGDDKRELWRWLRLIEEHLAALRLIVHPGAHPRPVAEGFPFLGFTVFPYRRRLKRRKAIHFQRRLRRLIEDHAAGRRRLSDVSASVRGWINHVRCANSVGLRKAVLRRAVVRTILLGSDGSRLDCRTRRTGS